MSRRIVVRGRLACHWQRKKQRVIDTYATSPVLTSVVSLTRFPDLSYPGRMLKTWRVEAICIVRDAMLRKRPGHMLVREVSAR